MAKKGLNRDAIVDAAAELAEEKGAENLTLHELASALGVKPASLYNHLKGLPELNARLTERAFECMLEALQSAVAGRRGADALRALTRAYRAFALEKPQLYKSMLALPHFELDRILEQKGAFMRIFQEILGPYDLPGEERLHYSRLIRSALHGFVSLEAAGFFSNPVAADESYAYLVEQLCAGMERAGGEAHA